MVGKSRGRRRRIGKNPHALEPDIAQLEIEMLLFTDLDVVKVLLEEKSKTNFKLLKLFKVVILLNNALEMGVKGYLLKESSEREILDCIKCVFKGKTYVHPLMTHDLLHQKNKKSDVFDKLSTHEINILRLIAHQKTTSEIAEMLFISPKTVSNHRSNISKKLELEGFQNGLLKWAIENKSILE